MSKKYYCKGFCTLTGDKVKCMYNEKYVFCDDCTRRNIVEAADHNYEEVKE